MLTDRIPLIVGRATVCVWATLTGCDSRVVHGECIGRRGQTMADVVNGKYEQLG